VSGVTRGMSKELLKRGETAEGATLRPPVSGSSAEKRFSDRKLSRRGDGTFLSESQTSAMEDESVAVKEYMETVPLEYVEGWEDFSQTKRKVLFVLPFSRTIQHAAKRVGTTGGYIRVEMTRDPVFKAAVHKVQRREKPSRGTILRHLVDKAFMELYLKLDQETDSPADEKIRIQAAEWVVGRFHETLKTGALPPGIVGDGTRDDEEPEGLDGLELSWVSKIIDQHEEEAVHDEPDGDSVPGVP